MAIGSSNCVSVEISSGEIVSSLCATLRPALESLELRTVLLIGTFSSGRLTTVNVEIVEQLEMSTATRCLGVKGEEVTALAAGR